MAVKNVAVGNRRLIFTATNDRQNEGSNDLSGRMNRHTFSNVDGLNGQTPAQTHQIPLTF